MGHLGITATFDESGKIDFKKINSVNGILSINNTTYLQLPSAEDDQLSKVKKCCLIKKQMIKYLFMIICFFAIKFFVKIVFLISYFKIFTHKLGTFIILYQLLYAISC